MINQLIQIISTEALVFEEFLNLLDRQKDALVENDTDRLNEITALQQAKLQESQALNRQREEITDAIKASNLISGDVTVSRLLQIADEDQSLRLTKLQETILALNDRITEARNTNAMLLNRSREFISRTMTMLSQLNSPENTYGPDGAAPKHCAAVAVDRRI